MRERDRKRATYGKETKKAPKKKQIKKNPL